MEQSEQWVKHAAVYHPRNPQESPLWNLLNNHYEDFERHYEQRFEKEYGFFRPVISDVVHDYLKCGDLKNGFARVHCPECHHEFLLAFSCRGRWFCPSCHAKKVIQFGEHLRHEILYPVPHRQYVFTIPKILRIYFKYDRKLLGKLCQCANVSLLAFLQTVTGIKDGVLGAVMTIHTFAAIKHTAGDYSRTWHPHLHAMVAGGLFYGNGLFYVMPKKANPQALAEIFRANVLKMLKKEGKITETTLAIDSNRISFNNNQIFINVDSLYHDRSSTLKLNIGLRQYDSDNDGMPDAWEASYPGLDPLIQGS